jgi:hypothetical protein
MAGERVREGEMKFRLIYSIPYTNVESLAHKKLKTGHGQWLF